MIILPFATVIMRVEGNNDNDDGDDVNNSDHKQ